jgi:hypothetical protein
LRGSDKRNAVVEFSLSGAYEVTLTVERRGAEQFACTWVVMVVAPGLRVELCWDKTGRVATERNRGVDLDLHLGKSPGTTAWFSRSDCYWKYCRDASTPWDYADTTNLAECTGKLAQNYDAYQYLGYCPNPRLDIDNRDLRSERYVTENINLDSPREGDNFRVMVYYYANAESDGTTVVDAGALAPKIEVLPLVNVYCGGALKGSFGGGPDSSNAVRGFDTPGEMWRVVDIAFGGRSDTDCMPILVAPPDAESIYHVSERDEVYP